MDYEVFLNQKVKIATVHAPELPNLITIIHNQFQGTPWADYLRAWEAVAFSILIATGISLLFAFGIRKKELIPKGLQNGLELMASTIRKMVVDIIGPEGEKYVPFIGTLFVYILTMNWMGLVPFMKAPSSNLNITVALAICVFVRVQYLNIKHMGFGGFLYHLAGSPKDIVGWLMVPLMFPIELLTQLTRPVTLALRLFGNVLGEDILIAVFAIFGLAALAFINSPIGLPLQIPFMFLGLLTGTMQALVFTLLSTVYILLSMPSHEDGAGI